jgi:acetoacetate decarboxylase
LSRRRQGSSLDPPTKEEAVDHVTYSQSFSLPIGPGAAYPPPPYSYRGVEDIFISYEADPGAVAALLPPGVEAADEVPVCIAWGRWIPFSAFGPYNEAYIMIRATFGGQTFLYQPFIFTDNEIPLVAGREIWGFAKKLAVMERHSGGSGTPFGEQMLFTVERPRGQRLMTMAIACDRLQDPAELEELPVLSTRLIPGAEPGPPSVSQLVRLDVVAPLHTSADGTPKLWTGRASVSMDARSAVDPWHLLAPTRIIQGWFGVFDFDLGYGKVVHDYLADDTYGSDGRVVSAAATR